MKKSGKKADKNKIPETLEIGVYWYEDDDGTIHFDAECMYEELDSRLEELKERFEK